MFEDEDSANIEWEQKKDFDDQTRPSRRIDTKKLLASEKKNKNNFKLSKSLVTPNLKKIRNKIKDVYDEDEDEEEEGSSVVFSLLPDENNSSLLNALKEEEKQKLLSKQTLSNQKMLETAGKMEALMVADKMSKQIGLKGLRKKVVHDGIQDIALNTQTLDIALKDNISLKTNIKTKNLSLRESTNLAKGLRKIKQATLAAEEAKLNVKEMNSEDLVAIGKSNDKKAAELILKKSGRKGAKSEETKEKNAQKIRVAVRQTAKKEKELG